MLIIQKYFFFFLFLKPSPYNEKPTLSYIFTFSYKKFLRYIIISDIFWRISHFLNLFLTSYSVKPESWVHTKIKFSKNLPVTRLSIKYYGLKTIYKTQYLFFFFHLNLTSPWVTVKFHVISHLFRKKKKSNLHVHCGVHTTCMQTTRSVINQHYCWQRQANALGLERPTWALITPSHLEEAP